LSETDFNLSLFKEALSACEVGEFHDLIYFRFIGELKFSFRSSTLNCSGMIFKFQKAELRPGIFVWLLMAPIFTDGNRCRCHRPNIGYHQVSVKHPNITGLTQRFLG
jgi:hypothetical protein